MRGEDAIRRAPRSQPHLGFLGICWASWLGRYGVLGFTSRQTPDLSSKMSTGGLVLDLSAGNREKIGQTIV